VERAPYRCSDERRRDLVEGSGTANGIDYLEVAADGRTLEVHFINDLSRSTELKKENVAIEGGTRVRDPRVAGVGSAGNVLTVAVEEPGDFSTYRLRLIRSQADRTAPPEGFDRRLSEIEFSFKVGCPNDFDCREDRPHARPPSSFPQIDYLAKDFASFRQLMLDRLAVLMPDWRERNPADLGIVLVELLAHAADNLSYYQDAVATEAYLGTARKRVSVRRHARLLNYPMHDGCNARVWVHVPVEGGAGGVLLRRAERPRFLTSGASPEVFEPLHDARLYPAHNEIPFYTWGEEDCYLPAGATRATLCRRTEEGLVERLSPGDVLIFEEVKGPATGERADADPLHRHAVRLTGVSFVEDPLVLERDACPGPPATASPTQAARVAEISWSPEDALPFPLRISTTVDNERVGGISVARGNVVLADHGLTVAGDGPYRVPEGGPYRLTLRSGPLTQQGHVRDGGGGLVPFDPGAPAAAALRWEMGDVQPEVELVEGGQDDRPWRPQRDLLGSDRFANEFVVETEEDGRASIRFGVPPLGRVPSGDLGAVYRVGNGKGGNVGAESIKRVVTDVAGIGGVRNPLPAAGGRDPEPLEQVRLYAPQAFRVQERAVTEADYAAVAQRHPEVQRAAATRRWSGSWHTWYVTVDRRGGLPVDAAFKERLRGFLGRFRLAGHDIEIEAPRFASLDVALAVCVEPGYLRSNVRRALLGEAFSNRDLPGGGRGFFHPDNFTFGQPVYLSQLVTTAMGVPGVRWVEPVRFGRWGQRSREEIAAGRIAFDRLEIARLDNDPSAPENGRIEFEMQGGL
jgi:hypothetical protein